jgi:hypothetical protein
MSVVMAPHRARAQSASEYQIKAAFLSKFAGFVQWPSEMDDGPICIGIIGVDPFGHFLDQGVEGETINGRQLQVRRFQSVAEVGRCQILFISSSESGRLREILNRLQGKPVLTVGDMRGFCESGGVINLKLIDSAIRLEINVAAGQRVGLRFSYKLLRLAKITPGAAQ